MGHIERSRRQVGSDPATGVRPATTGARHHAPAPPRLGGFTTELYRPRPADVLHALRRLDARLADEELREMGRWIGEQYVTSYGTAPIGYVARCFLGPPYVDHRLGLDGCVLEHYALADVMPDPFGAARMLARSGAYAYVEVYDGGLLLPVLADGGIVRP
jgi:hypothetical protein